MSFFMQYHLLITRMNRINTRKPVYLLCIIFYFPYQITTYDILNTIYEYVRYYTKFNLKNQVFSEKISMKRRPLFVVRISYVVFRVGNSRILHSCFWILSFSTFSFWLMLYYFGLIPFFWPQGLFFTFFTIFWFFFNFFGCSNTLKDRKLVFLCFDS